MQFLTSLKSFSMVDILRENRQSALNPGFILVDIRQAIWVQG